MTTGARGLALALVLVLSQSACDPATGVHIELAFDDELTIDSLAISGLVAGEEAFAPEIIPEEPRPFAPRDETFSVYVDAAFAGERLVLELVGLHDGVPVADTTARTTLVEGELVSVRVALSTADAGTNG